MRRRIVEAAAKLLEEQGREAVTTRAVSAAAGVQPPTLYRLFTDMRGLLDAVAAAGFDDYLARKHGQTLTDDPVEDLREGWNLHIEFGLQHPAHYLLMYGRPDPDHPNPASEAAMDRLRMLVERVAAAGKLAVGVETAVSMISAGGRGLALHLIGTPPEHRDLDLSRRMRESTIGAITGQARRAEPPDFARRATALKAVLGETGALFTDGERALLEELLDRLADAPPPDGEQTASTPTGRRAESELQPWR